MKAVQAPTVAIHRRDGFGDELRAVVGADVGRDAAQEEQVGQDIDDFAREELAPNLDRQALAGELVHDIERAMLRLAADQIEIMSKCRSRWLRALATSPRSRFSLRWLAQISLNEARRIRDDHVIGGW